MPNNKIYKGSKHDVLHLLKHTMKKQSTYFLKTDCRIPPHTTSPTVCSVAAQSPVPWGR